MTHAERQQRRADMAALVKAGNAVAVIARAYDVTFHLVCRACRENDVACNDDSYRKWWRDYRAAHKQHHREATLRYARTHRSQRKEAARRYRATKRLANPPAAG